MMDPATQIAPGFADPVFQSQAGFRALLAALSEPGLPQQVATGFAGPQGLSPACAVALLTLADYETPIWLPPALRAGPAGAWLRFHCGAAMAQRPADAAFALIDAAEDGPRLAEFPAGTDQFPDRSATILVACSGLEGGEPVTLSGPGIPGTRRIAPAGLRRGLWTEIAANAARYPVGVDLVFCHGAAVIGLPRSTLIAEAR